MATRPLLSPTPPLAWRFRVTDSPVASTSGARCVSSRRRPVPAITEAFHFRDTGSSSASGAAVMTDTARGSGAFASLRGLAFTSKPENIDPARAAVKQRILQALQLSEKKARKGGNRTATGRESPSGGAELLPHQATFNWLVREEQVDAIMDGMTSPDLMERVDSQLRV